MPALSSRLADAAISDPPLRLQNLSFVKRIINARVRLKPLKFVATWRVDE